MEEKWRPDDTTIRKMCSIALEMRNKSYTPYSDFCVGAALLAENGEIYTGCNIENAAYTPGDCAERTAFCKAISEGQNRFKAIAIAGGYKYGKPQYCPPCGVCRQIMTEFCDGDFIIYLTKSPTDYMETSLDELLPFRFGPSNLR